MGAHQSRPVQVLEDDPSSEFKTSDIINPTTSSQDCLDDAQTPLTGSLSGEVECNDDWTILGNDQLQRVVQFRKDIHLCKTDQERYEVCLQVRDGLLAEYTEVHFLVAAFENVMFTKCIEYRNRKERIGNPITKVSGSENDDTIHWGKFFDIAKRGYDEKSKCITALKTVARYWGEEKIRGATDITTHGLETDKLILELLQRAEVPNTDEKRGPVEALFLTGNQAAIHVNSDTSDLPIFTENQQPFQWSGRGRPIAELFNRMEYLDYTASVHIPSHKSTSASFTNRTLSQITSHFLANGDTDDPWHIPHMRNPLPSTLPRFLYGENCQLLLRIRDVILDAEGAEKVEALRKQRAEWRDVLEWAILSEGGNNTAPYKDFLPAWITAQEETIGFGWMSFPNRQEEEEWEADPHHYVGGRWRYVILKPGQTVFFTSATIRFMFRLRRKQTLGLGGHILQWSGIERWLQSVILQTKNSKITNEDIRKRALQYVKAVERLVAAKIRSGRAHELGGEDTVNRISILMKEIGQHNVNLGSHHPRPD